MFMYEILDIILYSERRMSDSKYFSIPIQYYCRDSTEETKEISVEERRAYEMEGQGDYTFVAPRSKAEPGLKISLARTPPT